jgi:hypothetical protein
MPADDDQENKVGPAKSLRLPSLLAPGRPSQLTMLASEIESRHGPAQAAASQPETVIESAARKLAQSRGDLSGLTLREKKAALELFWRRSAWKAESADVGNWLSWAETEWKPRTRETRICAAMLRHFDPQNSATTLVIGWLLPRQDQLWGRFGEFARRWRLADATEAREQIATALAAGEVSFLDELAQHLQARLILQGSGLVVAIVESFALYSSVRSDDRAWSAASDLIDLLGPRGLAGAGGPAVLRDMAKIAMVSGLVQWAARSGAAPAIAKALNLSLRLAGDPRESLDSWRDIPADVVAQVEKWLVESTLNAAFEIVAELKTDDPATVQQRRQFWLSYLPHIARARLLGARKARIVARKLKIPCCDLKTYLSDHCGFVLELRGENGPAMQVVELNNHAQTMFWPIGRPNPPGFDLNAYDGSDLRSSCDTLLSHLPSDSWPMKFADLIASHTGIPAPRNFDREEKSIS